MTTAYESAMARLPHALVRLKAAWWALNNTVEGRHDTQAARDAFNAVWVEVDRLYAIVEAHDRLEGP